MRSDGLSRFTVRRISALELKIELWIDTPSLGEQPLGVVVGYRKVCQCHLEQFRVGRNSGL